MSLIAGARLGPYEIVGPLGAGGMGEVYDARDTRLDRAVAIKILRAEFADSADRRVRFEREARAIASLNHPHICTLHDIGHQDGLAYLVMERIEGETLADRLVRGPLPFGESLACAGQVADALDRAHNQGIVHRDLKPANIMLTRSGVKLLDFGLARLLEAEAPALGSQTRTALTQEGAIVGTLQYMAPEQLEGRPTDARTDLFAFGAILYEMVSGRRAFDADSQAGIVGAILHAEVPSVASTPPAFARVLGGCLARRPEDRWSSAHDVRLLLQGIAADSAANAVPMPDVRPRIGRGLWVALAAICAAALVAAGVLVGRRSAKSGSASTEVLSLLPPPGTTLTRGEAPQISPDGREIAFVATDAAGKTLLYLRARETGAVRAIPGSEDATLPFWAPDSRRIGFFARGTLKTAALAGGSPHTVAPVSVPRGGTWSKDDVILYVPYPNRPMLQVPAAGGTPLPLNVPSSGLRWFPSMLPDGRHYLYLDVDFKTRLGSAIRVGSIDSTETREVVRSSVGASYTADGFLVYRRDTALVVQPFDATALRLTGTPVVVADRVSFSPLGYQLAASAGSGALVYREQEEGWHLTWFDRVGRNLGNVLPLPGQYNGVCLLYDGSRLVYDLTDVSGASTNQDIWMLEPATGVTTRLTFDPSGDFYPVCAPGSDEIMFSSLRDGPPTLFRQLVSAPGSETVMLKTEAPKFPTDWSRASNRLVYSVHNVETSWDIWAAPLDGGTPQPLLQTPGEERNGRLSPDGRFLTYTSLQGEQSDVFVTTVPVSGTKWQISRGGGQQSAWSADGRTLYYISNQKKIVAVDVGVEGSRLTVGKSRVAVDTRIEVRERNNQGMPFAVTADGSRFVVSTSTDVPVPITVVLNWHALLEK